MKLDEYIRDKRKLHNLTQQELAERAGVGYRFIRELENGKPSVRMYKFNLV
ncbi:helix-turn-helix transcriptional regulator [bacterium]|nr:helix-turn-helix transcriptional regulator [bacterium]